MPVAAARAYDPITICGGPATSLEIFVCHSGLPLVSKASTSALLVPTASTFASAPMPPESGLPALMR